MLPRVFRKSLKAALLLELYFLSTGHGLRMPEAEPPLRSPDRSAAERVSVVVRNRINLGAPLVVTWLDRLPPEEVVVEDGATVAASLFVGEAISLSAEVEALVTATGGGSHDPFGASDPYGEVGGDDYDDADGERRIVGRARKTRLLCGERRGTYLLLPLLSHTLPTLSRARVDPSAHRRRPVRRRAIRRRHAHGGVPAARRRAVHSDRGSARPAANAIGAGAKPGAHPQGPGSQRTAALSA